MFPESAWLNAPSVLLSSMCFLAGIIVFLALQKVGNKKR
jgi:hypothetical protein